MRVGKLRLGEMRMYQAAYSSVYISHNRSLSNNNLSIKTTQPRSQTSPVIYSSVCAHSNTWTHGSRTAAKKKENKH